MKCEPLKLIFKNELTRIHFKSLPTKLSFKEPKTHLKFCEQGALVSEGGRLADDSDGILLIGYDSKPAYDFNVISKDYDPNTLQYVEEQADLGLENHAVFNKDGTKLIIADDNGGGSLADIKEYSLSTPWRPNSATLENQFIPTQVTSTIDDELPHVMIAGDNNDILYVTYVENTGLGTGNVTQIRYSLTGAFDLSSPTQQAIEDVERAANDGFPFYDDLKFNNDGTKAYTTPTSNSDDNLIYQYSLSTPWIFSTRTQEAVLPKSEVPVTAGSGRAFAFLGDGTTLLINAGDPGAIKVELGTAYDISSRTKIVTNDPFTPESPQLRSLIETDLTEDFPSDPSYVELEESTRELTSVTVDINIYSTSIIEEFKVYQQEQFESEVLVESINATSTSYVFDNLETDTTYTFRIEAIDADGNIAFQDSLSSSTASDQLSFTEDSKDETSVTLSWTEDYYKVEGYNLYVDGVQDNGTEITIAEAEGGYLIDGLSGGTSYNISVEALDDQDNVLFTDSTSVTTNSVTLTSLDDDFESYSLGAVPPGWQQSGGADRGWIVTDQRANGGVQSLASDPATTDDETAAIEVSVELPAENQLSFDYRASTEPTFDILRVSVNGSVILEADNDTIWRNHTEILAAGSNLIKFEFIKDGSIGSLDDRCYIDNILTTPT